MIPQEGSRVGGWTTFDLRCVGEFVNTIVNKLHNNL